MRRAIFVTATNNETIDMLYYKLRGVALPIEWHVYYQPLLTTTTFPRFRKLSRLSLGNTSKHITHTIYTDRDYMIMDWRNKKQVTSIEHIFDNVITVRILGKEHNILDELSSYCTDYVLVPSIIAAKPIIEYNTVYKYGELL